MEESKEEIGIVPLNQVSKGDRFMSDSPDFEKNEFCLGFEQRQSFRNSGLKSQKTSKMSRTQVRIKKTMEEPEPENQSKLRQMVDLIRSKGDYDPVSHRFSIFKPGNKQSVQTVIPYKEVVDDDTDLIRVKISLKRCIIRQQSSQRIWWDMFVIVLALWNVFFIPFNIAFKPEVRFRLKQVGTSFPIEFFNYTIDMIFFIDIILNLRTTYLDKDGDQVFEPREIALHYLKSGQIFLDFLASIPLDSIPGLTFLQFLGLIKLMRIFRVPKLIQKINLTQTIKNSIKVLEVILLLVILYHITACFWYMSVDRSNQWIPPTYWIDISQYGRHFYEQYTIMQQYLSTLYYGVMALNSGEVGSRTTSTLVVSILIMFSGMFINALLFGTMAELILTLKRKQRAQQQKLDTANTAMVNLKLPMIQQRQVVRFLVSIQSTKAQQEQLMRLQEMISPKLRQEVRLHIFEKMIERNNVFLEVIASPDIQSDSFVKQTLTHLEIQLFEPENQIFSYGQAPENIFFIAKGSVYINNKNMVKRSLVPHKVLKETEHFGEIGLIYNCPRTMQVEANRYCTLAKMNQQNLKSMEQTYPTLIQEFVLHIQTYKDDMKRTLEQVLPRTPLFKHLPKHDLFKIIFSFEKFSVGHGEYVFKAGDKTKGLYVMLRGYGNLTLFTEGIHSPLKILRPGHMYSYDALIVPNIHFLSLTCINYKYIKEKHKKRRTAASARRSDATDMSGAGFLRSHFNESMDMLLTSNQNDMGDHTPHRKKSSTDSIFTKKNTIQTERSEREGSRGLTSIIQQFSGQQAKTPAITPVPGHHASDQRFSGFAKRVKGDKKRSLFSQLGMDQQNSFGSSQYSPKAVNRLPTYSREPTNTSVAFLSNEVFEKLLKQIPKLKENTENQAKAMEFKDLRPYLMDYYIPKKVPKTNQLIQKMKFITQKQGGRNNKFKFRNAVLYHIFNIREHIKSQTILERVITQITKEDASQFGNTLTVSNQLQRMRYKTTSHRFKTMCFPGQEEGQASEMRINQAQLTASLSVVLTKVEEHNKTLATLSHQFQEAQKQVDELARHVQNGNQDSGNLDYQRPGNPAAYSVSNTSSSAGEFLNVESKTALNLPSAIAEAESGKFEDEAEEEFIKQLSY